MTLRRSGPPAHIGNPHGYPDYTWPMVWVLQDGELWPIEQWVAKQGVDKSWYTLTSVNASQEVLVDLYTVPAGKVLYVVHFEASMNVKGTVGVRYNPPLVWSAVFFLGARVPVVDPFAPPIVVATGKTLSVDTVNEDTIAGYSRIVVRAYELDS
jgi:hypothetical protein